MEFSESFQHWMAKNGSSFLQPILAALDQQPVACVREPASYEQRVIAEALEASPLQLRLIDPAQTQLSNLLLAAKDQFYDAQGDTARLRPDWQKALFLFQPVKPAIAPAVKAALTPETGPAETAPPAVHSANAPVANRSEVAASKPDTSAAADSNVAVGIDLGTTYSVIAYLDSQGRPATIPNSSGDLLTPSVVLFDDEGTVVGKEAVLAAPLEPDRVADCVKRDMGSKQYRKPIRGEFLPPEVISSYILRRLKQDAERKLGHPITKAVITVPAYFDEPRRRATVDAGRLAGLEVLDILNEPTAAAIDYGFQAGYLDSAGGFKGAKPLRVLVYDLGGGTFDVTIVELSGQSIKAIATDGDVRLGGKDWDEKIIDMVAERFRLAHAVDPRSNAETVQNLLVVAENIKRTLTERSKATAIVTHESTRFKTEVTREQFEEATSPLVLRTRTTTEIVLLQAGLTWGDIDKVLLVGGSTRMPMISEMLHDLTGKELDRSLSADEAVAHGAALYADLLLTKSGLGVGHADFSVTNVNSHSLGISGFDRNTGRPKTSIIIPKNTPLPHSAIRRFRTAKANQTSVRICVLEGESEQPENCVEVGVAMIRGLPANLPAGWPVEVRYSYDESGRMQVFGKLVGHGAAVTVEFSRDNSLSDDDLMLWAECLTEESNRMNG